MDHMGSMSMFEKAGFKATRRDEQRSTDDPRYPTDSSSCDYTCNRPMKISYVDPPTIRLADDHLCVSGKHSLVRKR